jgi:hypothetical protein
LFGFLKADQDWIGIGISVRKAFVFKQDQHFIAAMDEVVEGKSGKKSFGISQF